MKGQKDECLRSAQSHELNVPTLHSTVKLFVSAAHHQTVHVGSSPCDILNSSHLSIAEIILLVRRMKRHLVRDSIEKAACGFVAGNALVFGSLFSFFWVSTPHELITFMSH